MGSNATNLPGHYSSNKPIDLINLNTWTPSIPNYPSISVNPTEVLQQAANCQTFNPLQNIDFGEEGGRLLRRLTRIIAHMGNGDCPIVGLEFIYSGFNKLFGLKGNVELSMVIDGAAGERIINLGVQLLYKGSDHYVQGFEVLYPASNMVF